MHEFHICLPFLPPTLSLIHSFAPGMQGPAPQNLGQHRIEHCQVRPRRWRRRGISSTSSRRRAVGGGDGGGGTDARRHGASAPEGIGDELVAEGGGERDGGLQRQVLRLGQCCCLLPPLVLGGGGRCGGEEGEEGGEERGEVALQYLEGKGAGGRGLDQEEEGPFLERGAAAGLLVLALVNGLEEGEELGEELCFSWGFVLGLSG